MGLHTYGVLVAIGFAAGIVLFWREGRHQGLDGARLLDLSFWSIVAGLVGSRLAFIALNAGHFIDACFNSGSIDGQPYPGRLSGCTAALRFWEGGFVFYGGAIATMTVLLLFCRREGWSFWRIGDLAAPALALGHALGRLGCFFAGCCFGKVCSTRWGSSFPPGSVAFQDLQAVGVLTPGATGTPPLHLTQLYEAAGEFLIFLLLLFLRSRWRAHDPAKDMRSNEGAVAARASAAARSRRERPAGGLILCYVASYAVLRFGVELFRGDTSRRFLTEWQSPPLAEALGLPAGEPLMLSVSQFTSLLMLAAVLGALWWRRRQRETAR